MSDPKDKDKAKTPAVPAAQSPGSEKRSGRVGRDERGNSVWEWQLETGVYSRDVSTQKLKKLELGDLSIADTAIHPRPAGLGGGDKKPVPGGGFNPYDNSAPASGGSDPYDNARTAGKNLQPKGFGAPPSQPAQPRKPADLQKLNEWVKLKKRVEDTRDPDEEDD